jgi:hypothetical protein
MFQEYEINNWAQARKITRGEAVLELESMQKQLKELRRKNALGVIIDRMRKGMQDIESRPVPIWVKDTLKVALLRITAAQYERIASR